MKLSVRSIDKLCAADELHRARVVRREIIDERPIVLVEYHTASGRKSHRVFCSGDVCYSKVNWKNAYGNMTPTRVTQDTYKCSRKEKFREMIIGEVAACYRESKNIPDVSALIMELFTRVSSGEYIGEFSEGEIYAQEIAHMLQRVFAQKSGLASAKTYCSFSERKKRYAKGRPMFFLELQIPLEKTMGYMQQDKSIAYLLLSDEECRKAAFYEDTLALIEELVLARRLSLNGRILCNPFPEEIPDEVRELLPAGNPALLYARKEHGLVLQVQRHHDPELATLCIFSEDEKGARVLSAYRRVHLLFQAPFGADVEDIAQWEDLFSIYCDERRLPD